MKRILSAFILLTALAACSSNFPPAPAQISFKEQSQIQLAVSDIQVINNYKSPMQPPHIEHTMPTSPAKAVETWAADRLRAKGGSPLVARVVIRDASFTDTELPVKKGFSGWFNTEESNRFDGKLDVMIEIVRPDGYVEAYVTAKAAQSRTILENASAADRDRVFYEMVKQMMAEVGGELEKQIAVNFSPITTQPAY